VVFVNMCALVEVGEQRLSYDRVVVGMVDV